MNWKNKRVEEIKNQIDDKLNQALKAKDKNTYPTFLYGH